MFAAECVTHAPTRAPGRRMPRLDSPRPRGRIPARALLSAFMCVSRAHPHGREPPGERPGGTA
ncbi:hypothetical protein [Actinomadura atramentaria]|uniref:hypothetical protein n=1 Tax=Actinomadura atramentaria TaxID=1990 RepID=UPI000368A395|nr:hypothetical protein [Actinomadura atramentaria]